MRNIQPENIQEHSMQVAVLSHALAEISNTYYAENFDPGELALLALYHDVGEVIIGDLPTPVKYFNPQIKKAYGEIEDVARQKLLSFLPVELKSKYQPLLFPDESTKKYRLVKAADKISAYIKCLEECSAGNGEFILARQSIEKELATYSDMPAIGWFMDNCAESFTKTLDELD